MIKTIKTTNQPDKEIFPQQMEMTLYPKTEKIAPNLH